MEDSEREDNDTGWECVLLEPKKCKEGMQRNVVGSRTARIWSQRVGERRALSFS